jgi:DNA-binding MarR family transcriptional regulator
MMFFHHAYHLNRRHERFFNQGEILTAILLKGPMAQGELLKIADSETLSELEKRRLIKHETKGEDNRDDVFSLTGKGHMFARRFQNFDRHAERFLSQGKILLALLRKGSTTQDELLEIVDGETLSVLEKQRSIKREDNRGDFFSLTKTGEMKARRFQIHDLFTRNMSGSLSDGEKDQLTAIIAKLHSNTGGDEFSHFHFRGSHFSFDRDHDHHDHTHGHTGGRGDK